jgi:cytochrome c
MRRIAVGVGVMAAAALAGSGLMPVAAQDGADKPAFYTEQVKPIFVAHCATCHMGANHRSGLSLETKASILKGGRDGAVIVPGDPAKSMLLTLIRHEGPADDPKPMPPKEKLSDADIATVTAWIKAGAVMPDDAPVP